MLKSRIALNRLAGLLFLGWVPVLAAQPAPQVSAVSPQFVQRGTTVDLVFTGDHLADLKEFRFSGDAGLSATIAPAAQVPSVVESSRGGISPATSAPDPRKVSARVTIAGDAVPGAREVRLVTPNGVSNPLSITVGVLPERTEKEPNNQLGKATVLELPSVTSGRIERPNESDFFKFQSTKGTVVVLDVEATRIGSPLDSSLAILDAEGNELARNEDAVGFDSRLAFTVPADGEYFVQLRDYRYQGGGGHRYRLTAGALPYVTSVYPLGGQRGQQVELSLAGYNLGTYSKLKIQVDPNAPAGLQQLRVKTGRGLSNPFPFDVGGLPETLETEPNNTLAEATAANVPSVLNGQLQAEKDVDYFKFKAPADQRLLFDVAGTRFGSSIDALLILADANGNQLVNNDDAIGADARIEYDVKKDQEYVLIIRDLLERGGEAFAYRLFIYAQPPSFSLKFYPETPRLNRGSHTSVRFELTRSAFNEPVRVTIDQLPQGVICDSVVISPGQPQSGWLTLSAGGEALLGSHPIRLVGTAMVGGNPMVVYGQPMEIPKPPAPERLVKEAFLTVLDQPPFSVELVSQALDVEQEQSVNLQVMVQRRPGFKDDIQLTVEGFAAGREGIARNFETAPVVVKADQAHATIPLKAAFNSEVGTRPLIVKAESGAAVPQYSPKIPATIRQLPFVIANAPSKDTQVGFDQIRQNTQTKLSVAALPAGSQSAAAESTFAVMVDRRGGFNQEVALSIEGLPEGVVAEVQNIPADDRVSVIKVTATDKAPAGKEFQFTVTGTATFQDRVFRQKTRPATLIITAPETTAVPDANKATASAN